MEQTIVEIAGKNIPIYSLDCVIIGSGCAAFNAADWLYDLNKRDIAIITEGINIGTSRNTGSDKQTYYKLSISSDGADSVREMADTLFSGGSTNGDTALVEAACSVKSFMKLALLGVPFPVNKYGEYVGYKTDHDPRQRATSAGPLTSKYMTECLEFSVKDKGIKIFDNMQAIKLVVKNKIAIGVIAIDLNSMENGSFGLTLFNCANIIMATGGPAGVYYKSVYPESQTGMTGMALEAGAEAVNLQEWQYGLASTKFRWNVSGTYQQVLPKYVAVDKDGNSREFLPEYFNNPKAALNLVFLKGYQWPFDTAKITGSSIIDIIIHHEIFNKGNRVYMDFRSDPSGLEDGFEGLSDESYNYLFNSEVLFPTPVKRLEKMNKKAIELYMSHGIDLYREALEVSVCAQHQNGGIAVDINWQSNIKGLYVAGEAAGTFGVYRPGGSALNSSQVGSMRAAEHIAYESRNMVQALEDFLKCATSCTDDILKDLEKFSHKTGNKSDIFKKREEAQKMMSRYAAYLRSASEIKKLECDVLKSIPDVFNDSHIQTVQEIPQIFKNRDILITQAAILSAMRKSIKEIGSRGSGLVLDKSGEPVSEKLPGFNYTRCKPGFNNKLISTSLKHENFNPKPISYNQKPEGCITKPAGFNIESSDLKSYAISFRSEFRPVRPMPKPDEWFENVWKDYIKRTQNNE